MENTGSQVHFLPGLKPRFQCDTPNEDDYEKLAKAINTYNSGGQAWMNGVSMPYSLKYFKHDGANGTNNRSADNCFSCEYSLEIRQRWLGKSTNSIYSIWFKR